MTSRHRAAITGRVPRIGFSLVFGVLLVAACGGETSKDGGGNGTGGAGGGSSGTGGSGGASGSGTDTICVEAGWETTAASDSCPAGPEAVDVVLFDPCCDEDGCHRDLTFAAELSVFAGACPPDAAFESGDPGQPLFSTSFSPAADPPPIGDLPKKQYGFAIILRNDQCQILSYGCTEADLRTIREIRIAFRNWSEFDTCAAGMHGGCLDSQACVEGRCTP